LWLGDGTHGVARFTLDEKPRDDAALTMAMFGLGTLPMMVMLTWSGARLGRHWQRASVRRAAASFVFFAGALTIASPWLMRHPALHGVLATLGCQPLPA